MFLSKNNPQSPPLKYGAITKEDLLNMGAGQIAYIKESQHDDKTVYQVYLANGTLMREEENYRQARNELRDQNIMCATIH